MFNITCYDAKGYPVTNLTQWDMNQQLVVTGLEVDSAPNFHFCNKRTTDALVVESIMNKDGTITVNVPNILLQEGTPIVAYVYLYDDALYGRSLCTVRLQVRPRPKPMDYVYTETEILTWQQLDHSINAVLDQLNTHMSDMDNPHEVTKAQVGLGNADNTADLNKPISIATQDALNKKADIGEDGKLILSQLPLGETSTTAYRGDRGKTAYDHSQAAHARVDATLVEASQTNGNILVNGEETTVYIHPAGPNPHNVTKEDVGLGNVDNTADADKPVSTAQQSAIDDSAESTLQAAQEYTDELVSGIQAGETDLANYYTKPQTNELLSSKVDAVDGMGLSSNNYTNEEKDKLSGIDENANYYEHPITSGSRHIPSGGSSGQVLKWESDGVAVWADNAGGSGGSISQEELDKKVDKEDGKGLSSNDYTNADKDKLAGIDPQANNYIHPQTPGYIHVPAGGAPGQILQWISNGRAVWVDYTGGTGGGGEGSAPLTAIDCGFFVEEEVVIEHSVSETAHALNTFDGNENVPTIQSNVEDHMSATDAHGNLDIDGNSVAEPRPVGDISIHMVDEEAHSNINIDGNS